jgi:hypothetical protein
MERTGAGPSFFFEVLSADGGNLGKNLPIASQPGRGEVY